MSIGEVKLAWEGRTACFHNDKLEVHQHWLRYFDAWVKLAGDMNAPEAAQNLNGDFHDLQNMV